jgi:hypothetical protein
MPLLEILQTLLHAPRLKAKYIGELPLGIREVMRETFESFSITFQDNLDPDMLKEICTSEGFAIMEKESRKEEIYDQFGNMIETRVVEWRYPFRIVDSSREIVLFSDPDDLRKIYVLPLLASGRSIKLRKDVISAIEKYMRKKNG